MSVAAQTQDRQTALKHLSEAQKLASQDSAETQRQAIEKYEAALVIFRALPDRFFEASTLNSLGTAYFTLGEWHKGAAYFEQALPLVRAAGNRVGEAMILFNLAYYHDATGDKQRALDLYQQVLPVLREVRNRQDEAATLNNLGQIYDSLGDKDKALAYLAQALRLERELGRKGSERAILSNLALLYDSIGDKQQALDHYRQALALSQATADRRTEIRVLNNLAGVWRSLGDDQQAVDLCQRALTISRAIGDKDGEAQVLHALAFILDMNREDDEALKLYEQSLALRRELGERAGEASVLGNIAVILARRGERQRALTMHEQVMTLHRATGDKAGEAATLNGIGSIYADLGQPLRALEYFRSAADLFRSLRDVGGEAAALYRAARAFDALGQLTEARAAMQSVIDYIETQRAGLFSQDLRASWFSTKQRYYDYFIELLMRQHEQDASGGFAVAALQMSERARARSLLELLAEARADIRAEADPVLLRRERDLRQKLNAKASAQTRLLNGIYTSAQAESLAKEIATLNTELQNIETQLRRASPRYAALTQPQPLSVVEIQKQLLDEETLLLEYALGEKHSYLWLVSNSTVTSYVLPARAEIAASAHRFYELLSVRPAKAAAPDAQFQREAARLSQMLLGPAAAQLNNKRLLIVAAGMLSFLPFGALPDPVTGGQLSVTSEERHQPPAPGYQPLITSHEIITLPSASVLSVIRRERASQPNAAKTVAVLADPVFEANDPRLLSARKTTGTQERQAAVTQQSAEPGAAALAKSISSMKAAKLRSGLTRLPFSREEADAILAFVAQSAGMKATDFKASRATAISEELRHYRIIHFATHGLLNSERPELSGLVLSLFDEQGRPQDGFLRLHEIYNLKLNADLVVLSACQTGLGREVRGEGLIGLTRGFMYAGAVRVVASLWQVDDLATAELMRLFYRKMLQNGLRPAAALRAAQLEMSRQQRRAAPYFWAAFTIQGEWR